MGNNRKAASFFMREAFLCFNNACLVFFIMSALTVEIDMVSLLILPHFQQNVLYSLPPMGSCEINQYRSTTECCHYIRLESILIYIVYNSDQQRPRLYVFKIIKDYMTTASL